jgi:hypothetical protein
MILLVVAFHNRYKNLIGSGVNLYSYRKAREAIAVEVLLP